MHRLPDPRARAARAASSGPFDRLTIASASVALALVAPALLVLGLVGAREGTRAPLILGAGLAALALSSGLATARWLRVRHRGPVLQATTSFTLDDRPALLLVMAGAWLTMRAIDALVDIAGFDVAWRSRVEEAVDGQGPWLIGLALASAMAMALEVHSRRRPAPWRVGLFESQPAGSRARWLAVLVIAWLIGARLLLSAPDAYRPASAGGRIAALRMLDREARSRPRDGGAQYAYAMALSDANRHADALPVAERAVAESPRSADARNLLGWLLLSDRRFEEALPHLRVATMESQGYEAAWHNYLLVLATLGRLQESARVCPSALAAGPENAAIVAYCARAYWYGAGRDDALPLAEKAARLAPGDAAPHSLLGTIHRRRGRFAESRAHLDSARAILPYNGFVLTELALTAAVQGDARTTIETLTLADSLSGGILLRDATARRMYDDAKAGRLVAPGLESTPVPSSASAPWERR